MMCPPAVEKKTPRILLCTADVGCGHLRAAQAVTLALRTIAPDADPKTIDALTMTPGWFNRVYRDTYLLLTHYTPKITGWIYNRTDRVKPSDQADLALSLESHALKQFCKCDEVISADLIICTHFLCARVLSALRSAGRLKARLAVVVTDQHPHAVWRVPGADLFLVASESSADELARHGIDRSLVRVTGIPIDSRFASPMPRLIARQKHDLPVDFPVLLVTGGGLGLGGLDHALQGIIDANRDVFTVVVCGRNEKLKRKLTRRLGRQPDRYRVLGLTYRMHELMAAADLMVGKPGGLTTSEATAIGLPMVLLRPLPGQEEHNAQALTNAGVAILCRDPYHAGYSAANLSADTQTLTAMREKSLQFGRPASARAAAAAAIQLCA